MYYHDEHVAEEASIPFALLQRAADQAEIGGGSAAWAYHLPSAVQLRRTPPLRKALSSVGVARAFRAKQVEPWDLKRLTLQEGWGVF